MQPEEFDVKSIPGVLNSIISFEMSFKPSSSASAKKTNMENMETDIENAIEDFESAACSLSKAKQFANSKPIVRETKKSCGSKKHSVSFEITSKQPSPKTVKAKAKRDVKSKQNKKLLGKKSSKTSGEYAHYFLNCEDEAIAASTVLTLYNSSKKYGGPKSKEIETPEKFATLKQAPIQSDKILSNDGKDIINDNQVTEASTCSVDDSEELAGILNAVEDFQLPNVPKTLPDLENLAVHTKPVMKEKASLINEKEDMKTQANYIGASESSPVLSLKDDSANSLKACIIRKIGESESKSRPLSTAAVFEIKYPQSPAPLKNNDESTNIVTETNDSPPKPPKRAYTKKPKLDVQDSVARVKQRQPKAPSKNTDNNAVKKRSKKTNKIVKVPSGSNTGTSSAMCDSSPNLKRDPTYSVHIRDLFFNESNAYLHPKM